MRVVVLGCGGSAGVPMLGGPDGAGDWGECDPDEPRNRRSRSSIVIESDDGQRLLVDTSPELRNQLLDNRIGRIDALFYTHAHADHVAGLDEVRSLNRILGRPIEVFATREVLDELAHRFAYAFLPWTPPSFFRPVLLPRAIASGETLRVAGLALELFRQSHGRSDTLGFRIGRFGYSTDVVHLNSDAQAVLRGTDTWLVDCFQRAAHPAHAWLDLVVEWSRKLEIRRTILTHMGVDLDWRWMAENLPAGFEAAYDGMVFEA
ncbi:MBL fold metallo-hydrolase [Acetobacteraceae bacterium KSS8]|uniref:MBL fold metallo-hydrolase n=1 Tax=Endosaccharibacter trunci TaxID=2812733 RepID=A0ABT1WA27_9PROT|nr:MBL fold metallo-hydrolase [Acetobacteraceae bacterium KSS8]